MNQTTIGLFHCSDKGWAEYLKKLLLKDQNITIEILNLEELVPDNPPEVKEVMDRSAVTLLLMTPNMCDFIPGKAWLDDTLQKIPEYHTIIAVIAFVDDSEIETIKTGFSSSTKWQTIILSQHTSNNIKMVADIIDMVEKSENMKRYQVKEIIPSKIHSPGEKVAIIFKTSVSGTVQVSFDDGKNKIDTKRINEATYRFRIPNILPKSKAVNIYMDSGLISTKSIHFIRYGHEVFENIVFLKQCLGVVTNEELDLKLCDIMEKSEPCDGSLSKLFSRECLSAHSSGSSNQSGIYPTILHLAAAYNLKEFTSLLLEAKGALRAFEIKNKNKHNPADLAEANGHHDLAKYIREFTDTESAAESCELYMHMSNKTDHPSYLKMDRNIGQEETLDDIYSEPSSIRLAIITESSIPPTIFPRKNSLPPVPDKAFKQLDSGDLVRPGTLRSSIPAMPIPKRSASANPQRHKSDPQLSTILTTENAKSFLDKPRKFDAGAMGSSSMQELIDVMNLVKTEEFTEEDAEQSLKSWRERPTSRSYRDRKKALAEITGNIYTSKPSKQSLLGKLIKEKKSKRKDKEEWIPNISAPIVEDQFTPNISTNRASSTSNSSASTFESRDSLTLSREYSDSEDEMQADASLKQPPVQRRSGGTNRNEKMVRRMSRKDMYLKISMTVEEEPPPPIPPRKKYSLNTGVPFACPPPIVKRKSKN